MPAKSIFLDTNGWFALFNVKDALHTTADAVWRELGHEGFSIVLTDWIVAETGNGLARTPARSLFAKTVGQMMENRCVRLLPVTPNLLKRALDLYASRSDKTWGLVDCASFTVMSEEGIVDAFTTDQHFAQAGFTCLRPTTAG